MCGGSVGIVEKKMETTTLQHYDRVYVGVIGRTDHRGKYRVLYG